MKTCPNCGFATIIERKTCKQCGAAFDPAAQVLIAPPRLSLPAGCWWRLLFMLAFLLIVPLVSEWSITSTLRDPNHIPTPRGGMILKLRVPADQSPIRDLELYPDGTIWSGTIEAMYFSEQRQRSIRVRSLDQSKLQEVLAFQHAWCAHDAQVYHPTTHTPAYGLGIACPGRIEAVHIAPAALPDALRPVVQLAFPEP